MSFEGFPGQTFGWFAGLGTDNSKRYFTTHGDTYDRVVHGALEEMLEEFADELSGRVSIFAGTVIYDFRPTRSPSERQPTVPLFAVGGRGVVLVEALRNLLAGAKQAARDRPLAHAQRAGGLAVGQAGDVDGDEHVAKLFAQLGNRLVHHVGFDGALGTPFAALISRLGASVERLGRRPARSGSPAAEERVA